MEYCYHISKFKTFSPEKAKIIFSDNINLNIKNDEFFLVVNPENESDDEVFSAVQRECDRIFFLTGEQLDPQLRWKKNPNGGMAHWASFKTVCHTVKKLPENIGKQQWTPTLAVQLRLWQLAKMGDLPIAAKINLLFQIIEIVYPKRSDKSIYQEYKDSSSPPALKTECLLLRDLVSHGKGAIKSKQLKIYCKFLGISESLHDPTDANFRIAIKRRTTLIEREAAGVIKEQIAFLDEACKP